jgi:glycosyltransferase involved in cell wall biosynthesis
MKEQTRPVVSVVIPLYNMQDFIKEAIDSVLSSTYPAIEVIVVDDGSTDGSGQIAKEYAENDKRVKYYHQSNAGASSARNHAIRVSQGEYILPVDADNLISSDFIERASFTLSNNSHVKVVSSEAEYFGERTGPWKQLPFSVALLARKNLIDNCAMYRKSDWEAVGGYCDDILGREDWDFWISLLKRGGEMTRLPIVGLYYRDRINSKRKTTRHLKHTIIDQLNSRHRAFFYRTLGGKLRYNRTWSKVINFLYHLVVKENVLVSPAFPDLDELVFSVVDRHDSSKAESRILYKNLTVTVKHFRGKRPCSQMVGSSISVEADSEAARDESEVLVPIGYFEKRVLWGLPESYLLFVNRQT